MTSTTLPPVVKHVTVPAEPEEAFRRFTHEIGTWWPMGTHSTSKDVDALLTIEAEVGGEIVETGPDGVRHEWGSITRWEPGRYVAFTWHPGEEADVARLVEVVFEPAEGGTRATLTHAGWEVVGEGARQLRDQYDRGWNQVLAAYTATLGVA